MKRAYLNICTFMAFALAVSSCSDEDIIKDSFIPTPSNTITFGAADVQVEVVSRSGENKGNTLDISERKIESEDGDVSLPMMVKVQEGIHRAGEDATSSRAAAMDESSDIQSLQAWATHRVEGLDPVLYINGDTFGKSGTLYTSTNPYMWPSEGGTLDFVTVGNYTSALDPTFDANQKLVSFDYTVPSDAANQPDIVVATANGIKDNLGESVPLDFKHIMATVNIKVGTISENVSGTIKSITFKGIYNKGTYQVDNHGWVNRTITDGGVFSVPLPDGGVAVANSQSGGALNTTSFMMIPQQLFTGAEIEIKFNDKITGEKTLRASIQGNVWAMNTTTNYLLNIDGSYNLQIVPLDNILDSHYIITKVEISSEYQNWILNVYDTTDDDIDDILSWSDNSDADITIQLESEVNPMAKQGFWTDKIAEKPNKEYVITSVSARGSKTIEGNTSVTSQIVYVFIPENISGKDRNITLLLANKNDPNARKILTIKQNPVKWLDPTGKGNSDEYWGCELLLEGGQVPWGFCWDGITEEYTTNHGGWGQYKKIPPALAAAGFSLELLRNPNYFINIYSDKNSADDWVLQINYSKIGNIEIAESLYNGYSNTLDLYNFDGISTLAAIKDFIANYENIEYTMTSKQSNDITNTLDFAAMYAIKRNRFHLYQSNFEGDIVNVPIIEDKDINWYLPAKDQFPILMQANWGQQFTFNDYYWTSTAYLSETTTNNAHSYAYVNGVETIAHRTSPYLTMAIRRKTNTADVVVKPEDVVVPGGGENGPELGEGGDPDNNTGGDMTGGIGK